MAARRPFWKWHRWKSIGFCLWPPSTCIWNLKLKFQSKLDLCSGNHVVYRQTDRRTDGRTRWIQYTPPPTSLGGGIINTSFYVYMTRGLRRVYRWCLLPHILQIMPRNPKYDQFQPKGHHNEKNPQSTTKMPENPKFYPFHEVKIASKLEKSTNCNHNLISSESGQDTSACKISGHFLNGFFRKCLETPNLTRFTKSK